MKLCRLKQETDSLGPAEALTCFRSTRAFVNWWQRPATARREKIIIDISEKNKQTAVRFLINGSVDIQLFFLPFSKTAIIYLSSML